MRLALAGLLLSAGLAGAVEPPSHAFPPYFVNLRVRPTTTNHALAATLPVTIEELHPRDKTDADRYLKWMYKKGLSYDWSPAHGRFVNKCDEPPCRGGKVPYRVFVLKLSRFAAPSVRSLIRSRAPSVYRGDAFEERLDCLAFAIFGLKAGSSISSLFPIPMGGGVPVRLADSLNLLECFTTFGTSPPGGADAFAFYLVKGALTRGLADRGVVTYGEAYSFAKKYDEADLNEDEMIPPDARFVTSDAYGTIMAENLTGMVQSLQEIKPWLGSIPVGPHPDDGNDDQQEDGVGSFTIDFADTVSTTISAEDTTSYQYKVGIWPGARPDGIIDFDGFARPAHGSNLVEIWISFLAGSRDATLRTAVIEGLLDAWRWKQILGSSELEPGGENRALTQTLLRINEPLWDYLVLKTAQAIMTSKKFGLETGNELDDIEFAQLRRQVGDTRAWARAPLQAWRALGLKVAGRRGDGLFPLTTKRLDHLMNALIVTALDGGNGVKAWRSSEETKRESPIQARKALTSQIPGLLAAGFTRPKRDLSIQSLLITHHPGRGRPTDAKTWIDADLTWLASACQRPPPPVLDPLAHPFGALHGSRMQKTLTTLVTAGQPVAAITWDPEPPGIDSVPPGRKDRLYYLLSREEVWDLGGIHVLSSRSHIKKIFTFGTDRYLDDGQKARSTYSAGLKQTPQFNDHWWSEFTRNVTETTADDLAARDYGRLRAELRQYEKDLTGAFGDRETLLLAFRLDGNTLKAANDTPGEMAVEKAAAATHRLIERFGSTADSYVKSTLKKHLVGPEKIHEVIWRQLLVGLENTTDPLERPASWLSEALSALASEMGRQVTIHRGETTEVHGP